LKRAHSSEPDAILQDTRGADVPLSSALHNIGSDDIGKSAHIFSQSFPDDSIVGSPLKKQKPLFDISDDRKTSLGTAFMTPGLDASPSASTQALGKQDLNIDDEL
jgi:hypothetical protein